MVFLPVGVFLWVIINCLKPFPWAGDCLSLSTLGFLCCCSKVPSTSEAVSNVEMLSSSENTCDSTSVMSSCGSEPLSPDSGSSSLSWKGWVSMLGASWSAPGGHQAPLGQRGTKTSKET
uniref:Secreted protein n=3 Tax=Canis lupus TaxID=9612 RepID=A0A8C0M5V7_CANLF